MLTTKVTRLFQVSLIEVLRPKNLFIQILDKFLWIKWSSHRNFPLSTYESYFEVEFLPKKDEILLQSRIQTMTNGWPMWKQKSPSWIRLNLSKNLYRNLSFWYYFKHRLKWTIKFKKCRWVTSSKQCINNFLKIVF